MTGVFGLLGSGQRELGQGIFGAEPFKTGSMTLNGEPYAPKAPADAVADDVYMVPEDGAAKTMIKDWSITATSTFPFLGDVSRFGILNSRAEDKVGELVMNDFGVVAQSEDDPVI